MRLSTYLLASSILFTASFPLHGQTDCDGADHTVLAGNYYFNPASLTINAGETVAFVNEGGNHDVNGNISVLSGMSFGNPEAFSLPLVTGNSMGVCMGTVTFTVPGTYNYDCSIGSHAANGMVASITVQSSVVACNDDLACNYDENATSAEDCVYNDSDFDLSEGVWLVPTAALDPALGCNVQTGEGILVGVTEVPGQAITVNIDADFQAFIDGAVAEGLLSSLQGILLVSALQNAVFSICGETITAISGLNSLEADWDGEAWDFSTLGFNLAPATTLADGCPDPAALNFAPCANPDENLCDYGGGGCNDPLACNFDSTATAADDCNYFDTQLFSLEENDFVGITDYDLCESGYAAAYSLPIPLGQDSAGVPLSFTLFPDVQAFLIANGFEIAAQDLSTVMMSVCDTVLNYNSLVIGDVDMIWDGTGFPNEFYGSFVVPESSLGFGCPDDNACNFDACVHPFVEEGCTYLETGTVTGDTIVESGGDIVLTLENSGDNAFEWTTDCAAISENDNVATITATEDCEVCLYEYDADGCEAETCFNISVFTGIPEQGAPLWQLMPNPAADALRVVWGGEATVFEVHDLNGRLVHTCAVYRGVTTLDLSTLLPGFYLAGPQGGDPQRLAIQR